MEFYGRHSIYVSRIKTNKIYKLSGKTNSSFTVSDNEKYREVKSAINYYTVTPVYCSTFILSTSNGSMISTMKIFCPSSSKIIPTFKPTTMESESPSTSDCSSATRPSTANSSVRFIEANPSETRSPPLIFAFGSHSAGPSGVHPKSPTCGSYSNFERKRQLPCSITSVNAPTMASVEQHNKLMFVFSCDYNFNFNSNS